MWAMSGLMGSCELQHKSRTKMGTKNFSLPLLPKKEEPQPIFCSLFPWWNAPSPQFPWSNAQAPWTDASQAISVTFASFPADTAATHEGHLATAAQNPGFKSTAPAPISHQVPRRPQTTTLPQFPLPFWLPEGCHTANTTATGMCL